MARFVALPVSKGDAFYLEDESFSVLVDGGMYAKGFRELFTRVVGKDQVDVLICTHNDADHANGVIGFLREGLSCTEVWLPGSWLGVLPEVLKSKSEVLQELARDVRCLSSQLDCEPKVHFETQTPLEVLVENLTSEAQEKSESNTSADYPELPSDGWPANCLHALESITSESCVSVGNNKLFHEWVCWNLGYEFHKEVLVQLLSSAFSAADRIKEITLLAFHRGLRVRWFEFDKDNPGGGLPELQPMNGREVKKTLSSGSALLFKLALTVANRRSLVFHSPGNSNRPAVLFTADSDLDGVKIPSDLNKAIVSAPHHGSDANSAAYTRIRDALSSPDFQSIHWVRSDGRFRSRPGREYLGLGHAQRTCTICRLGPAEASVKQAIRFTSTGALWVRDKGVSQCRCV